MERRGSAAEMIPLSISLRFNGHFFQVDLG